MNYLIPATIILVSLILMACGMTFNINPFVGVGGLVMISVGIILFLGVDDWR